MSSLDLLKKAIDANYITRYVCKYRPILNYENEKSIFNIIKTSSLWFASAKSLNDPFDCQLNININSDINEIEEWLKSIRTFKLKYNEDDIKVKAFELYKNPNYIQEVINEVIDNNGVCCFSKNYDNILQWSHYADSHKGVCLIFDILKDPSFFDETFSVEYRNDYREYNAIKNFDKFVQEVLLPKYIVWDYEAEIRSFSNEIGLKKFNPSALTKIIFGCNTSQEDELKIVNYVSEYKYPNIEFLKAVRNNKEYKLDFETISAYHTNPPH
jgi:hypothetical protein